MKYKPDWESAKLKWQRYWKHQNEGRPLMSAITRTPEIENAWQKARQEGGKGCVHFCQGTDYLLPDELMYKRICTINTRLRTG